MTRRFSLMLTGAAAALVGVAGCGSGAPNYTVLKDDDQHITLVLAGATTDTAKAAIRDYLHRHTGHDGDPKYLVIEVVKSRDTSMFVCRSRYVVDEAAAHRHLADRQPTADGYPAYSMNCP